MKPFKTNIENSLNLTLNIICVLFLLTCAVIALAIMWEKHEEEKVKKRELLREIGKNISVYKEREKELESLIDEGRKEFSRSILAEGEIQPDRWNRYTAQTDEFAESFTNYSTTALYFIPFYGNSSLSFKEGTNLTEVIIDKSMILFGGDSNIVRKAADAYTNIFEEPFELRKVQTRPGIILVIRGEPKLNTNGLITLK